MSLTGLHEVAAATTPSTIVQRILNGTYTDPAGSQVLSPVIKIVVSETRGRCTLFANKQNAQSLLDYTSRLLEEVPRWLQGHGRYSGGRVHADVSAAAQYTRTRPLTPTQPTPQQDTPHKPHQSPQLLDNATTQPVTLLEPDPSTTLIPAISHLTDQINKLQATVDSQAGVLAQLIHDGKTTITTTSTLPSQVESVISQVNSTITTTSESYKTYVMDSITRLQSHMHDILTTE